MKLGVADLKPEYEPGSFGFDPLGLYPKVRFEIFRFVFSLFNRFLFECRYCGGTQPPSGHLATGAHSLG